jgi:hypothetical protein
MWTTFCVRKSAIGFPLVCAVLIALAAGCGRKRAVPEGIPQQEVPSTIQSAFSEATPEVKAAADEVVRSIQNQEATKAFLRLQQLSSRPDLTAEQSDAAARAMVSVRVQLQAAAARGDKAATEILELYRSTK